MHKSMQKADVCTIGNPLGSCERMKVLQRITTNQMTFVIS